MQISSPIPLWERVWRRALELAGELTDGMIWQGIFRVQRQPEDVRHHAEIMSSLQGIDRLFFQAVAKYPEWFADPLMRKQISPAVSTARRIGPNTVELSMDENRYLFRLMNRPCASPYGVMLHQHGTLELAVNGKNVLRLKLMQDQETMDFSWHKVDIDLFEPGPWVEALRHLNQEILAESRTEGLSA